MGQSIAGYIIHISVNKTVMLAAQLCSKFHYEGPLLTVIKCSDREDLSRISFVYSISRRSSPLSWESSFSFVSTTCMFGLLIVS